MFNIDCRDVKIDIGDDKEEEAMAEAYECVKENETYICIELRGDKDKYWNNWDCEEINIRYCRKISSCKYFVSFT